ncbi:MAG: excinuclease ABC subunit UvrC [Holosporales bacterium]|nr:excinuclease ABC subunit UvrC [Holosporales bacterium]
MIITVTEQAEIIKRAAAEAGDVPGVYMMMNSESGVMYVGKAKSLKKRLLSYTRTQNMSNRLKMMISKVAKVEFIITRSETEALILEINMIKDKKPFFNVMLKDDQTYPYIVIDETTDFPRIYKYRSSKSKGKNFYGPYPLVTAIDSTLKVIQKAFMLRGCSDNYFKNRKRPCLQYFIKRCSAPCVCKISIEEYQKNVCLAKNVLEGNDEVVRNSLIREMREASKALDFEKAARIRDQITNISEIQAHQYASIDDENATVDFIVVSKGAVNSIVGITFYRNGRNVGSDSFCLENSLEDDSVATILESFIGQFYKNIEVPAVIVTSNKLENKRNLEKVLNVKIIDSPTENYKKIIENASENMKFKHNNESNIDLSYLENLLNLEGINRIEVYDNSHIMGTNACGAMIVFEEGALRPNLYRKFNIDNKIANKGDDLAMMKFVLQKRINSERIPEIPDLIIIDGGKTQLDAALEVIENISIISIAKQNNRKVGDEKVVLPDGRELFIEDQNTLNFLIMLRDEAHKTAITFHRKKMKSNMKKSELDLIPTIGPVRKKKLLEHFGSINAIKKASLDDIMSIRGIDRKTADIVFGFFNKRKI